jgi:hypothetical protein
LINQHGAGITGTTDLDIPRIIDEDHYLAITTKTLTGTRRGGGQNPLFILAFKQYIARSMGGFVKDKRITPVLRINIGDIRNFLQCIRRIALSNCCFDLLVHIIRVLEKNMGSGCGDSGGFFFFTTQ